MRIAAVVAANGTGHFRRSVGVLHRLATGHPSYELTICGTQRQMAIMARWWRLDQLIAHGARFVTDVECGVRWPLPSSAPDLLGWRDRLAGVPAIHDADLVVSDNLAAVLRLRPDAVLMGSFLWSEVLAGDGRARPFVDDELAHLRAHRPPMLCVDAIASPAVLRETSAVPLPWMCEDPQRRPRALVGRPTVGVCGGTTAAAAAELSRIVSLLAPRFEVVVDRAGDGLCRDSAAPYRRGLLSEVPLTDVDLVLCRPGAGTVMDCVATSTPFLTFHEPDSPEMSHVARRLAARGVAETVGTAVDEAQIIAAVDRLSDPGTYRRASVQLREQRKDGLDQAAHWLAERLATDVRA